MLLCSPLFFLFSLLPRNEASFQMLGVVPPERIKSEESCTQVRFVTNLFVLFDEFAVEVRPHTDVVKIDQRNAVVVGFVVAPPIAQIAKKKEYGEKRKRSQNMFEVEHFIGSCCLEVRTGFEPVLWVLPIRICNPSRSTAPSPDLIILLSRHTKPPATKYHLQQVLATVAFCYNTPHRSMKKSHRAWHTPILQGLSSTDWYISNPDNDHTYIGPFADEGTS